MITRNPALATILQHRSKIDFFRGLSETEINEVIFNARVEKFRPRHKIYEEGSTDTNFLYYLLQGEVDLLKYSEDFGEHKYIRSIDKPTLFGETRVFTKLPRNLTVVTGKNGATVFVFSLKSSKKTESPRAFAKLYENIIKNLSKKFMVVNDGYLQLQEELQK